MADINPDESRKCSKDISEKPSDHINPDKNYYGLKYLGLFKSIKKDKKTLNTDNSRPLNSERKPHIKANPSFEERKQHREKNQKQLEHIDITQTPTSHQ